MSPTAIKAGIITWLVTQTLGIIYLILKSSRLRKWKINEAVRRGHVLKGFFTGEWEELYARPDNNMGKAFYRYDYIYEYKGKKKHYIYLGNEVPPESILLYYLITPKYVFTERDLYKESTSKAVVRYVAAFLLPVLFAGIQMGVVTQFELAIKFVNDNPELFTRVNPA